MPTPTTRALNLALMAQRDDVTAHEVALEIDRFAAQRGAGTGGGGAEKRARALIFDLTMAFPGLLKFWSLTQVEAAILRTLIRALRSSRQEGAEAMREACATAARGPSGHDECDHGAGYMNGRLDAALAIEALPIPGK